jgi:hypothetical protein
VITHTSALLVLKQKKCVPKYKRTDICALASYVHDISMYDIYAPIVCTNFRLLYKNYQNINRIRVLLVRV